ncbi:MAG: DUF2961 domain-containing protein [Clostridia bacterium]|nr:DUF2961 domain-containing protein [Clostridia bacterium]
MFTDLTRSINAKSFAFCPENPKGEKGGGSQGDHLEKRQCLLWVQPGETLTLVDTDGPGVIESMWFGGFAPWDFILRIYWDGQKNPSVESPLSAFFAYPFYENVVDTDGNFPTLSSAMVSVTPCRGLNCFWQMPFKKHCRITLENRHPSEAIKTHYMITGEYREVPEDSLYFCASYRQALPTDPLRAYVAVDGIKGKGHFVGLSMGVTPGGCGGCWTEGEPKMYIDGEKYPSINYTGLEDYFGGSYNFGDCDPLLGKYQTYSTPYMGMYAMFGPIAGKPFSGKTMMPRFMLYRWHLPDPIRFEKEFRMTLQDIRFSPHGNLHRHDDFVTVAYWYQTLPTSPLAPLPSAAEVCLG